MLTITIPETELWDEFNDEFITIKAQSICLEHSLVSISKWESKWKKPFLTNKEKSYEEFIDYIKCMTITQNVDPKTYTAIDSNNMRKIKKYIEDPMSATTFSENKKSGSKGGTVTSELIYYWMIALNIPYECQRWHLNRLFNLIRICEIKNEPPKKMSKQAILQRNAALNAQRRQKLNTKG